MFSSFFSNNEEEGGEVLEWHYDGLPTPTSEEEYQIFSDEALDSVQNSVSIDGEWISIDAIITRVCIEEKSVDGSDITSIRTRTTLENVSIEEIVKCIHSPTFDERKQVYDKLIFHEVVKEITPDIVVTRSRFSAPFPVTDREFLTMRSMKKLEDGSYVVSVRSINDESVPFDENYVRGESNSDIYIFPVDGTKNNVGIISVDNIDPKGWVPTFVVNSHKSSAGDWLIKMQEIYGNE